MPEEAPKPSKWTHVRAKVGTIPYGEVLMHPFPEPGATCMLRPYTELGWAPAQNAISVRIDWINEDGYVFCSRA